MKVTKRKTAIKCPICKRAVIGHKYPPVVEGFSCHVVMTDAATRDKVSFEVNGSRRRTEICRDCEKKLKGN